MTAIAPSANIIQQESVQFNNPVSEASGTAIGASINYILNSFLPIGSIIHSMLTTAQFQAQVGTTNWVLADGTSYPGSVYQTLVGSPIPDLRGQFLRGKNNGRADGNQNPAGEEALGTEETPQVLSHNHGTTDAGHTHGLEMNRDFGSSHISGTGFTDVGRYAQIGPTNACGHIDANTTGITINNSGTAESRPFNVTVNIFIRIN